MAAPPWVPSDAGQPQWSQVLCHSAGSPSFAKAVTTRGLISCSAKSWGPAGVSTVATFRHEPAGGYAISAHAIGDCRPRYS